MNKDVLRIAGAFSVGGLIQGDRKAEQADSWRLGQTERLGRGRLRSHE